MTENEAVYRFKDLKHSYERAQKGSAVQEVLNVFITLEDLDMAIQALEEIQQYRAIGTIEECRNAVERMKKGEMN